MVNKQRVHKNEGGPTPLDESWWAAVLAEEEQRGGRAQNHRPVAPGQAEVKSAPHLNPKPAPVDWARAQQIYEHDEAIYLQVVGHNRGGLLVEGERLQGFVPLSHLVDLTMEKQEIEASEAELTRLLSGYLSQSLRLKIIECDPERGRIVLSERAALAETGRRNQLLDTLKHGDCVFGIVTNVTDFGVFVDLGGVEGLIHVSELSWGRVRHPSDVTAVGDRVEAFVINVDKDRCRVALSLKRLRPNPWDTAEVRYKPGQVIDAVITSIVPFGAFARLEEGLDGLIHVSEMGSYNAQPGNTPLREGQEIVVRVIHVDASRQRLGLSLATDSELESN
jgi:small subunit ribosomal protein S1